MFCICREFLWVHMCSIYTYPPKTKKHKRGREERASRPVGRSARCSPSASSASSLPCSTRSPCTRSLRPACLRRLRCRPPSSSSSPASQGPPPLPSSTFLLSASLDGSSESSLPGPPRLPPSTRRSMRSARRSEVSVQRGLTQEEAHSSWESRMEVCLLLPLH